MLLLMFIYGGGYNVKKPYAAEKQLRLLRLLKAV